MRFRVAGGRKDYNIISILNSESYTIKKGSPVFLKPDGDGIQVQSGYSLVSNDPLQTFFTGLAIDDINSNSHGEAIVFGFFDYSRVVVATRSASSVNWASYEALSLGQQLEFYTHSTAQAFLPNAPSVGARAAAFAVLAQAYASAGDTVASTASDGAALHSIASLRTYIKSM